MQILSLAAALIAVSVCRDTVILNSSPSTLCTFSNRPMDLICRVIVRKCLSTCSVHKHHTRIGVKKANLQAHFDENLEEKPQRFVIHEQYRRED